MRSSDAQKSEVHEATDDASTSPASNTQQGVNTTHDHNRAGADYQRGEPPQRARTNVAGVGAAEADDASNAPPGHLDLNADLSKDASFYPTGASKKPPPEMPGQPSQNLSP
jgi:hypothetical protein